MNIKNFKEYESLNRLLKVGDYIILKEDIQKKYRDEDIVKSILITKTDIGKFLGGNWFLFNGLKIYIDMNDIKYWSENKEELEQYLTTKKYNL